MCLTGFPVGLFLDYLLPSMYGHIFELHFLEHKQAKKQQ
jgi:hypothetical protein